MPPDTTLLTNFALGALVFAMPVIIGVGWSTRETVQKIHADVTNDHSGLGALWEKVEEVLTRINVLERERYDRSPAKPDA